MPPGPTGSPRDAIGRHASDQNASAERERNVEAGSLVAAAGAVLTGGVPIVALVVLWARGTRWTW